MIQKGIAKRYAQGLFGVGEKDGKYRKYRDELESFGSVLKESDLLYRTVMSPIYDVRFRKEIVSDIGKSINLSLPVLNLLLLLVENDRIKHLFTIAEEYSKLVDEKDNVIRGKLYSPYPLDAQILREIEGVLTERLKKKVMLTVFEDKSLIAGLKLVLDGTVIDGTIRKQLDIIKETILKE